MFSKSNSHLGYAFWQSPPMKPNFSARSYRYRYCFSLGPKPSCCEGLWDESKYIRVYILPNAHLSVLDLRQHKVDNLNKQILAVAVIIRQGMQSQFADAA